MTVRAYSRVSTTEQGSNGHGLDAQRGTIEAEAQRRGWDDVRWYVDAGWSGSNLSRPGMTRLLRDVRRGDVVVVARLDRLSRSLTDFAGLMAEAKRRRWSFVAVDLGVDTTTATGSLIANVMASVAEWEREVIAQRTKDAMLAAKLKGRLPGRRSRLDPVTRARLLALRGEGMPLRAVATLANQEGLRTVSGVQWRAASVHAALRSARLEQAAQQARAVD